MFQTSRCTLLISCYVFIVEFRINWCHFKSLQRNIVYNQELRNVKPRAVSNEWLRSDACVHDFMLSLTCCLRCQPCCLCHSHIIFQSQLLMQFHVKPSVIGSCSCKSLCPSNVYATPNSPSACSMCTYLCGTTYI